jgi:hypothetical protein
MDQSRILALKKKAEEDQPGFFGRASQATDEFLQDKVVNPLTEAGYPNLGAGIAAVPSAVVGLPAEREAANARPDAVMAGDAPIPVGKISASLPSAMSGKAGSRLPENVYNEFFDRIAPIARGDVRKFDMAMDLLERDWMAKTAAGAAADATKGMTGAMQMKASDQVKNVFSKKAPDVVVKEASTSAVAPKQTARKYESYGDEFARKELAKARAKK